MVDSGGRNFSFSRKPSIPASVEVRVDVHVQHLGKESCSTTRSSTGLPTRKPSSDCLVMHNSTLMATFSVWNGDSLLQSDEDHAIKDLDNLGKRSTSIWTSNHSEQRSGQALWRQSTWRIFEAVISTRNHSEQRSGTRPSSSSGTRDEEKKSSYKTE